MLSRDLRNVMSFYDVNDVSDLGVTASRGVCINHSRSYDRPQTDQRADLLTQDRYGQAK